MSFQDDIDNLDDSWLKEFERSENDYKNFYTEEITVIPIHLIYIGDNSIEKIKEEKIILKTPGVLQKEELVSIIKHNMISNNIKYSLSSILKYNINLEPETLKTFLRTKDKNIGNTFLQAVKHIDNIKFDKTITMFHDINDIFILFTEKLKNDMSQFTKKSRIHHNKKTKRNVFKDIVT
jgi:hypothetical protein